MSELPAKYTTRKFNFWHRLFYWLTPAWFSALFVRDHFEAGYLTGYEDAGAEWGDDANRKLDDAWRGYSPRLDDVLRGGDE